MFIYKNSHIWIKWHVKGKYNSVDLLKIVVDWIKVHHKKYINYIYLITWLNDK